jgi:hypothetical protein
MTAKALITIDDEGRLHTDAETLARLKNRQFVLQADGQVMALVPDSRLLSDIEDKAERMAAYRAFKARIMRRGGGPLPTTRAELNDLVYD